MYDQKIKRWINHKQNPSYTWIWRCGWYYNFKNFKYLMNTTRKQGWRLTFTEISHYFSLFLTNFGYGALFFSLGYVVVLPTCGDKGGLYRGVGEVIGIRKSPSLAHNPGIIKTTSFWKFKIPFKSQKIWKIQNWFKVPRRNWGSAAVAQGECRDAGQ